MPASSDAEPTPVAGINADANGAGVSPEMTTSAASGIHTGVSASTISSPESAASSRATRRAKRRRRSSGSRLFRYDRGLGARSLSALNDSKQHTAEAREALYPRVLRAATKVAVTSRCVRGIDARGLHNTNLAALRDVLARVACEGSLCLSDGFAVPPTGFEQRPVIGGDATSAAIAAAAMVAKVSRDRFMQRMEARYPGWEFATHVGYSTPEHRAAIERLGVSPLHRMSFQSMAYQQLAL